MKLSKRILAGAFLAAVLPLACPVPAYAESKTTRPVMVTATVPMMLQIARTSLPSGEGLPGVAAPETPRARTTIALHATPEAVTNQGATVTDEWRRLPGGRLVRLYTAVVR